jgi:hypothetical protein
MVRSGVIVQLMGFLFAVFFCCSCATLSFEVPTNKFLVPESDGPAFSSRFGAGYGSTSKITVQNYNSLRQVPPDTSYGKVTPNDSLNIHLEMAVYQPIDLFVSTIGTGVKVQALGDSVKEAKPGNRSLAFAFAGSGGPALLTTRRSILQSIQRVTRLRENSTTTIGSLWFWPATVRPKTLFGMLTGAT